MSELENIGNKEFPVQSDNLITEIALYLIKSQSESRFLCEDIAARYQHLHILLGLVNERSPRIIAHINEGKTRFSRGVVRLAASCLTFGYIGCTDRYYTFLEKVAVKIETALASKERVEIQLQYPIPSTAAPELASTTLAPVLSSTKDILAPSSSTQTTSVLVSGTKKQTKSKVQSSSVPPSSASSGSISSTASIASSSLLSSIVLVSSDDGTDTEIPLELATTSTSGLSLEEELILNIKNHEQEIVGYIKTLPCLKPTGISYYSSYDYKISWFVLELKEVETLASEGKIHAFAQLLTRFNELVMDLPYSLQRTSAHRFLFQSPKFLLDPEIILTKLSPECDDKLETLQKLNWTKDHFNGDIEETKKAYQYNTPFNNALLTLSIEMWQKYYTGLSMFTHISRPSNVM